MAAAVTIADAFASVAAQPTTLYQAATASYLDDNPALAVFKREGEASFAWTALGDSYASGVGTGEYTGGGRCLRFDQAYPLLIDKNPEEPVPDGEPVLPPNPHDFKNVVCSGAEAQDIIDWQLLDEPTSGKPNRLYGERPEFGSPDFATLTAGGDDIDFPGILFNCILGVHIYGSGPERRTCTAQREHTWSLLNDQGAENYVTKLEKVISAIMEKGQASEGEKGSNFRLYVTGYGRFFNADTSTADSNCFETTFQIDGLWSGNALGKDGAEDAILTTQLRQEFNDMSDALNTGINTAVDNYNRKNPSDDPDDPHTKFIDIQTDEDGNDMLAGHRFCEKGKQEPDPSNGELHMWHYPYAGSSDAQLSNTEKAFTEVFDEAYKQTVDEAGPGALETYPNYGRFLNAVFDNITPQMFTEKGISDDDVHASWGPVFGNRTRVFHPQLKWHELITRRVLEAYKHDHPDNTDTDDAPPSTTTNAATTPSFVCTHAAQPGGYEGEAGYCVCGDDGNTYPISPMPQTTVIDGVQTTYNNDCPYTAIPTITTDLGPSIPSQPPAPATPVSSASCFVGGPAFKHEDLMSVAKAFCRTASKEKWSKTKEAEAQPTDGSSGNDFWLGQAQREYEVKDPADTDLTLSVTWNDEACYAPGDDPTEADFSDNQWCKKTFFSLIDQCQDGQGGTMLAGCVEWSITGAQDS